MKISIIIPVVNEAPQLEKLLPALIARSQTGQVEEIIVVDAGSQDDSREVALRHGALVLSANKGRAVQMNAGARETRGDILYFLHADSLPPDGYDRCILEAVTEKPVAGCFQLRFQPSHWFLDFSAWFTRINLPICRGGDQSLFVPRTWFESLHGFDERFQIYEDNEFIGRLYRNYRFTVLPERVITSSRRYEAVGFYKLQLHYTVVHLKRFLGHSPESLYAYYQKNISRRAPGISAADNNP